MMCCWQQVRCACSLIATRPYPVTSAFQRARLLVPCTLLLFPKQVVLAVRPLTALLNSAGRLVAGGVLLAAGSQLTMPLPATADDNKRLLEVRFQNAFQKGAQKSYFQVRAQCLSASNQFFHLFLPDVLCCSVRQPHHLYRCAVASQCACVVRCRSGRRLS